MNPSKVNRSTDFPSTLDESFLTSEDATRRRERRSSLYMDDRAKNFQANYEETVGKLNKYYKQGRRNVSVRRIPLVWSFMVIWLFDVSACSDLDICNWVIKALLHSLYSSAISDRDSKDISLWDLAMLARVSRLVRLEGKARRLLVKLRSACLCKCRPICRMVKRACLSGIGGRGRTEQGPELLTVIMLL